MPFDAFTLHCVAGEIEKTLIASRARISKIYQIGSTDLLIHFRGEQQNHTLLLATHPSRARVHLTTVHYPSPTSPPPFCMLLRKHLIGASIISLEQLPLERVLKINLRVLTAEGSEGKKTLVAEIMERRSNLILLDEMNREGEQIILGAVKSVPPFMNRFRTILPHHPYVLPPPQQKIHPLALDYNYFHMEACKEAGRPADKFLLDKLRGLSPFLAREIAMRAGVGTVSKDVVPLLWKFLQEILNIYTENKWEPTMLCDAEKEPLDFAPFVPHQAGGAMLRHFESMSKLLDEFFLYRQRREEKEKLLELIKRQVRYFLDKAHKREKNQLAELEKANNGEHYRLCGELLNMNLHTIPLKATVVSLQNVYSQAGELLKITLDPRLSPSANAQRYFKKYRKAGNTIKTVTSRLNTTRREIAYLESVLYNTEKSDWQGLEEIREELEEGGYLPGKPQARTATFKNPPAKPHRFVSAGGEEILAGRNNRQNDLLLRQAAAVDLWFHAKNIPGAHVILKGAGPSQEGIEAAAMLAAMHSKGAHSGNVPVDYTAVKNVRRIAGAGPGMVTYTKYRTLFVTPDDKKLKALLQKSNTTIKEQLR